MISKLVAVLLCLCWAANALGSPLNESEKRLLQEHISIEDAVAYGKQASDEGLGRIIKLGDSRLVSAFDRGMQAAKITILPPSLEALVIANFDNQQVGEALRGLSSRYQTRQLFDLHYARIKTSKLSNEPSLAQILNTDQTGMEKPLLEISDKPGIALFLAARGVLEAAPRLIAGLKESCRNGDSTELRVLMSYPSAEIWRETRDEITRLSRVWKLEAPNCIRAPAELDKMLSNPQQAINNIRQAALQAEQYAEWIRQRDAFNLTAKMISPSYGPMLLKSDIAEHRSALDQLEAFVAAHPHPIGEDELRRSYFQLGMRVLLGGAYPVEAAEILEKSGRHGDMLAYFAAADAYQLGAHDKDKSIEAYARALESAGKPEYAKAKENLWLVAWAQNEINFLKTGKPFHGGLDEDEIAGFFSEMQFIGIQVEWILTSLPGSAGPDQYLPGWPLSYTWLRMSGRAEIEAALKKIDRNKIAHTLENQPMTRFVLPMLIPPLTMLPDADSILRYLDQHDPSGYWSTCLLGTVYFINQRGAAGLNDAVANGMLALLPGLLAPDKNKPLVEAANRFMRARGFRVVAETQAAHVAK